jgi:hypothetical protein
MPASEKNCYDSSSVLILLMISPLVEDFRYLADTTAAEQVLNRTYQPPDGTDCYTKLLLDQLYISWEVTKMVPILAVILTDEPQ